MNPWLVIFLIALGLVCCLMVFYVILSYIVIRVAKRHAEKTFQKYTEKIEKLLPGKNCGKCGCATCHAYAESLVRNGADDFTLCKEGGEDLMEKLQECIGELEMLLAPAEKSEPDQNEHAEV